MPAVAMIAAGMGCHGKPTEGGVKLDTVTAAFDRAGWKASAMVSSDPAKLSAQRCLAGPLASVDAIVCEYGSAEALARGKKAIEAWVGSAVTGVALENGKTVLGLADRGRSDPHGQSIHDISKAFLALK